MRTLFDVNPWKIVQNGFDASKEKSAESIFSIGNGSFGQRANFEEQYSGDSLQGSYIGGVYYPDKTKVGWWKNGYPEYFAKVLNSCNWIGINIDINHNTLDLAKCDVSYFYRELDMHTGTLYRKFICSLKDGKEVEVNSYRFCSMHDKSLGVVSYSIKPLNFSGDIEISPYLDFNIRNADSNYDEMFWNPKSRELGQQKSSISAKTKKTNFEVAVAMSYSLLENNQEVKIKSSNIENELYVAKNIKINAKKGSTYTLYKYVSILSNLDGEDELLSLKVNSRVDKAIEEGYDLLLSNHTSSWKSIWKNADIIIEGDIKAQQAIRFNIFHLYQTYTGDNAKLNIGPKGFTGEKYGGATYWDTEAYCLPFFLKTAPKEVSKQLLIYRYNHLSKAINNAEMLGFSQGAALYPMVTMNGEECHNEWEITFEEIHRNGAIAYAIYNYIRHTNDISYLENYGIKVLIAIARFWAQRVNWSDQKNKYVILGVTGPNEYENNINNNWYTNYIAKWCLSYTLEVNNILSKKSGDFLKNKEREKWSEIIDNMYLPKIEGTNIFLQNDGFLDKDLIPVNKLSPDQLPINQNWSWDRILRSVYIKQADVLQGLYFFEDHFNLDTIKENVYYYEPFTVHESSLSPCIHSVLYSLLKDKDKAYEMYLRTARLDLDDYNNEVEEGLHITSMSGSWLAIVEGFAGVRIREEGLHVNPIIPDEWKSYNFNMFYKNENININVNKKKIIITNNGSKEIPLYIKNRLSVLSPNSKEAFIC